MPLIKNGINRIILYPLWLSALVAELLIMPKNFKIIIEYDGTRYHGWQRQKKDATIQGEIEKALWIMTTKSAFSISPWIVVSFFCRCQPW